MGFTFIARIICAKSAHSLECSQLWSNSNWVSAQWEQAFLCCGSSCPLCRLTFPAAERRCACCVQRRNVHLCSSSLSISQLLVFIEFPWKLCYGNKYLLRKKTTTTKTGVPSMTLLFCGTEIVSVFVFVLARHTVHEQMLLCGLGVSRKWLWSTVTDGARG